MQYFTKDQHNRWMSNEISNLEIIDTTPPDQDGCDLICRSTIVIPIVKHLNPMRDDRYKFAAVKDALLDIKSSPLDSFVDQYYEDNRVQIAIKMKAYLSQIIEQCDKIIYPEGIENAQDK